MFSYKIFQRIFNHSCLIWLIVLLVVVVLGVLRSFSWWWAVFLGGGWWIMVWWVFCSVSLVLFPSSVRWSLGVCFSRSSGCLCSWAAGSSPSAGGLFSWVFSCGFYFYVYAMFLFRDWVVSDRSIHQL